METVFSVVFCEELKRRRCAEKPPKSGKLTQQSTEQLINICTFVVSVLG